ncbi:IS21 family transposase [Aliiglaciecola sp.]|nr:IS21 family transposase [Aliiglaciecola sp.]
MNCVARVRELSRIRSITNFSNRKIAETLGCSHQTVGRDLKLLKEQKLDCVQISQFDDEELSALLFPIKSLAVFNKRLPNFDDWVNELTKKHQTIRNLWFIYYKQDPETAYELSTIYQKFEQYRTENKLEACFDHKPGDEAQYDYCGKQIKVTFLGETEPQTLSVFVGVLCYSHYFLAYATKGQTSQGWCIGTRAFLEYIGGVPKVGVPDNPKAVVITPRPNLKLNPKYEYFSKYYDFIPIPARPGKPQDKAIAEKTVQFVSQRILMNIESMRFKDIDELNAFLRSECDKLNAAPFQKRSTSRLAAFQLDEKPLLTDLPDRPLAPIERATCITIPSNYRVVYDEHRYSVPWRWRNKPAELIVTKDEIRITYANKAPIVHQRSYEKGKESVVKSHLHPRHQAMVLLPMQAFVDWAQDYGENTVQLIEKIFEGKPEADIRANHACKSVQSIAKKYSDIEVEAAVGFCLQLNKYTPTALKHALASKVYEDEETEIPIVGMHENVRGANHYEWMGRQ